MQWAFHVQEIFFRAEFLEKMENWPNFFFFCALLFSNQAFRKTQNHRKVTTISTRKRTATRLCPHISFICIWVYFFCLMLHCYCSDFLPIMLHCDCSATKERLLGRRASHHYPGSRRYRLSYVAAHVRLRRSRNAGQEWTVASGAVPPQLLRHEHRSVPQWRRNDQNRT